VPWFAFAKRMSKVFNVFNSNTATTYEAIYDPTNAAAWFQPTAVLQPRFVRFIVQLDF
jgi:hypothetical protein